MPDNLPALSNSRPFIAPRMSVGMKVAICFLVLTGILILSGMVLTLAQIMQRLNGGDQENVAQENVISPPAETTATTVASTEQSISKSYPVIGGMNTDKMVLPQGAVVQQLVPSAGGVYMLIDVPHEGQRIVILDARTGNIRRDIRLENSGK